MSEHDFQDAVAEVLQLHHFLVFHQRPARKADGRWASAVEYDGAGFFDLVAMRPGCPTLFVECKAADGRLSKDQTDWLTAGQGVARWVSVLRPSQFRQFVAGLEALVEQHPLPDGWIVQLRARTYRHELHRQKNKIAKTTREGKVPAAMTTTLQLPANTAVRLNSGQSVYLYRGHLSDGSVCVYGPVIWDGQREKWVAPPKGYSKFQSKRAEIREVRKP